MSIAEKLTTIANQIPEVYKAGQQSEYDRFWDLYQNSGEIAGYAYAFAGFRWNDSTYTPKYPIVVSNATCMFQDCYITDTKVDIDLSQEGTTANSIFYYASQMKNIRKVIVNAKTVYTGWFMGCRSLEEIRFEGTIANNLDIHWSTNLSLESVASIIGALGGTASSTLTLPSVMADNAEYTAIISTKPSNWTVSYL